VQILLRTTNDEVVVYMLTKEGIRRMFVNNKTQMEVEKKGSKMCLKVHGADGSGKATTEYFWSQNSQELVELRQDIETLLDCRWRLIRKKLKEVKNHCLDFFQFSSLLTA
jgi:hypothetical protein